MAQKFLNGIDVLSTAVVDGDNLSIGSTVLDVQGSQGQLFSVTNSLTGDLFAVSDISGIPILNVNSSGLVTVDGDIHLSANYIGRDSHNFIDFATDNHITFKTDQSTALQIDSNQSVKVVSGSLQISGDNANFVTLTESGTGDFTIDALDDIRLDAGGADVVYKDGGTEFGRLSNSSTNFVISASTQDKDIIFKGNDGGSIITALTLDMSNAGTATFAGNIVMAENATVDGVDISGLPTSFAPTDAEENVQADWTETTTTSDAFILNKPTIPTDFVSAANGGTFSGDIIIAKTDPTITFFDNSGANTDPNGTIIFSEVSGTQNFDINYNGDSDRLEFRGRIGTTENTDLVYIKRNTTNTVEFLGGLDGTTATFTGDISANNLSGTNTGDQDLSGYATTGSIPTDFVSAASGGNFGGNLSVHTGAGTGSLSVGRTTDQNIKLYITDTNNSITAANDADENQEHNFILNRTFAGTGANNFKIQKGGADQLSIDSNGQVTISGNLVVGGSTTTLNTQTVEVEDNIIVLNKTQSDSSATAATSGISIYRGLDASDNAITEASLIFDDGDDTWDLTNNLIVAGNVTSNSVITADVLKLTNDATDTTRHRITVYDSGSTSYGMMLWNTNGTSGEWATMIYGPNQSSRRISFGKANADFATNNNHAGVDELAWLDLDNGNYFTDGNIYPGGSTTKYVSTGRIDNWNTAHEWGDHDGLYLPIGGGNLTGDLLPNADSTYDIGSNASKWAEGHFDHLYVGETGNNPRIDIYTENDTANIADTFTDTTTDKSYIYFQAGTSSNDPGYIMHETSNASNPDERNEGVLHLVPSDDNGYGDYVSIHGTNDADALKLHTNGRIETAANIQLDFLSGSGSVKISDSLDVTGSITVAGTVDGVDISALPTTFAPTNAEQNVNADWTSTSGDSQILNNPGTPYLTGVTDRHIFPGLAANATQARKHHIGRVYYCPRHWDTTWQNLYFTINEETYNSGYIKYHLFGYYNGTDDQTLNLRVVDYRGLNSDLQRYKIVLGDHTDTGWDHSSQNVYYTDIYVEVSHYKSVKVVIDALGHSIIHSNPTSGAGITVIYETPTITNITYTNETYDTTYIGSNTIIWNSANDGAGSGLDADTVDGTHGTLFKRINGEFVLDVNDDFDTETGTWSEGTNSAWGEPNITGGYAYNDGTGSRTYDIPTGAQSCWISHLTWSSGGYVDVLGVQSDGGEVFLRRINTHQTVQNSDEGAGQHDGSTITFAGTSLSSFGKIKFQNKEGRFHFTGITFSSSQWEGTEGTGMIHPKQITQQGSGNGLDSDKLDGQQGTYYLDYANFTGTPAIPTVDGVYLPLAGGTMTGDLRIENGGPKIYLKDTTDDDDQAIYFQNNGGTIEYVISTQDFTQDGLADGMFIGSISSDELGLVTNNTTALYIDTSQNSKFFGNIKVNEEGLIDFAKNTDVDGAEVVGQVATATYTAAFFDYVIKKGDNVRAGIVYACHDGSNNVEFSETSTTDLGSTSDVVLSVDISSGNMRLIATVASNDWSVKSLIRAI